MVGILLEGESDTGKTTTLKELFWNLLNDSHTSEVKFLKYGNNLFWNLDVSTVIREYSKIANDFICVFIYREKKICINSIGDKLYLILRGLDIASSYECDKFIGAGRITGICSTAKVSKKRLSVKFKKPVKTKKVSKTQRCAERSKYIKLIRRILPL